MNIPKYSLENRKVIYFFLAILLIGGVISFFKLPKKEDAPFVIKTAVLVTQYPGANPHEVEKLITEPIEREIQSMTDVYQIKSESYFGLSKISIELQPTIDPDYMPVKWDELRRKVAAMWRLRSSMPFCITCGRQNDAFVRKSRSGRRQDLAQRQSLPQRLHHRIVRDSRCESRCADDFTSADHSSNFDCDPFGRDLTPECGRAVDPR